MVRFNNLIHFQPPSSSPPLCATSPSLPPPPPPLMIPPKEKSSSLVPFSSPQNHIFSIPKGPLTPLHLFVDFFAQLVPPCFFFSGTPFVPISRYEWVVSIACWEIWKLGFGFCLFFFWLNGCMFGHAYGECWLGALLFII